MTFLFDQDVPEDLTYLLRELGRRRTRAEERAAFVRLLQRAGESGLRDNINFA